MCPFVLLTLLLSFFMLLMELTAAINVTFYPAEIDKLEEESQLVASFSLKGSKYDSPNESNYKVVSDNNELVEISNVTLNLSSLSDTGIISGTFIVHGKFLGFASVRLRRNNGTEKEYSEPLKINVIRKKRAVTTAFVISVAVLVALNYVNMGCALDLKVVKSVLRKPIAPIVGFLCQYLIMPLVAYGLAKSLFDQRTLQLGLFTFGCSPGGGASNMWTVLLKGNLNLSLTMTFISVLAALGMMPFWLFTLGRPLFSGTEAKVPFVNILTTLVSMIVPLGIGLIFQRFLPRVAKFCCRILASVCIVMIIFIIIFGTYANLYMFKLFTWKIIIAATANVWLGFISGAVISRVLDLPKGDIIAIAVETGVQNSGIAIILLGFSLTPPEGDLASVIPVAASIMTPFPLLAVYCGQKIYAKCLFRKKSEQEYVLNDEDEERRVLPTLNSSNSISTEKQASKDYM